VAVLAAVCAIPALASAPAKAQAQAGSTPLKVLVLPFGVDAGPQLAYLEDALPANLARALEPGFQVVPRQRAARLMRQRSMETLDLAAVRELTLLTGADYAVYGRVQSQGGGVVIEARLVEGFGLQPAESLRVRALDADQVLPAVDRLARQIVSSLADKDVVTDIEVRGNEFLEKDVVLLRIQTRTGEELDRASINKDIRNIHELGYFEDVQVEVEETEQGKRLVYIVEEKPKIKEIRFHGHDELDDEDDFLEAMTTKPGSVVNTKVLADDLAAIREMYRKEGFYNASLDYRLEEVGENQAILHVDIEEGSRLYIKSITLKGVEKMDPDDVKDQMMLKERWFFSWLTGSGVLNEDLIERDVSAIEAYYANNGFIEAKVSQPEVVFGEDGIHISVEIQEGERYRMGEVRFAGDLLDTPQNLEELLQAGELAEDDAWFDRSVVRGDIQTLTDYYSNYGYAYAQVDLSMDSHPEQGVADVVFSIDKRQKIYVNRVTIQGNDKTRDNVIRRELRITDGQLFSGKAIRRSSQRLNKLGYFSEVDIEPVPGPEPTEMDLKVTVKEQPTGMLSAGIGYSTYSKVFLTASIKEENLLGRSYSLGFEANLSEQSQTYTISFTNPNLYDSDFLVGADTYLLDREYSSYSKQTIGAKLRLGHPLGEYTRLFWGYRADQYTIYDLEDDASDYARDYEGDNWSSVAHAAVVRDTTDRRFNPSEGTKTRIFSEYGGGVLGGDDNFISTLGDYSFYVPLFWGTVFHGHTRVGFVFRNQRDEIPPFERFYLGGMNTVRGYANDEISPIDPETGDEIGGVREFYTNLEFLFPIWEDAGLVGLAFYDTGNTWEEGDSFFVDNSPNDADLVFGMYRSVGFGLRWYSPLGPMRLEYGYALDNLLGGGDRTQLEFSLGQPL
jgi:outer membrane protein insertion porin family